MSFVVEIGDSNRALIEAANHALGDGEDLARGNMIVVTVESANHEDSLSIELSSHAAVPCGRHCRSGLKLHFLQVEYLFSIRTTLC